MPTQQVSIKKKPEPMIKKEMGSNLKPGNSQRSQRSNEFFKKRSMNSPGLKFEKSEGDGSPGVEIKG